MTTALLNSMGIVRWRQRRPLLGAKAAICCRVYHLLRHEQAVGYLLLDTSLDISGHEEKIENLIDAMLAAVQLKRIAVPSSALPDGQSMRLIIGADLNQLLGLRFDDNHDVVLRHPLELLQQPQFKREAWQELKKFQQLLNDRPLVKP